MRETKTVKKAKKVGGSVVLSLTGFIQENRFYKVECQQKQVIVTPLDV